MVRNSKSGSGNGIGSGIGSGTELSQLRGCCGVGDVLPEISEESEGRNERSSQSDGRSIKRKKVNTEL